MPFCFYCLPFSQEKRRGDKDYLQTLRTAGDGIETATESMKRMVINKYKKVAAFNGTTFIDTYNSVNEALKGIAHTWITTISSDDCKIRIYGVIIEDNGYEHCELEPMLTYNAAAFKNFKYPIVTELRSRA